MNTVYGTNSSETIDAMDGVTNGNDTIYGYGGDDTIYGLGGDDTIYAGDGNDWVIGGDGNDTIYGSFGNDALKGGGGADHIDGGLGDDTLGGGLGADILIGGLGIDTANYNDSSVGVSVNLQTGQGMGGTAEDDTLFGIENLTGSAYGDFFYGNGGTNVLNGLEGDDVLRGGGGADILNGGSGMDTADYSNSSAGVFVSLIGDAAHYGEAEGDDLNSIENVTGSALDDDLRGDDGSNMLSGGHGADTLKGFGGADTINGGLGNDQLFGMNGDDTLHGDILIAPIGGDDWLNGGAGADTMDGWFGSDTYIVDNAGDVVNELLGAGTLDRVKTSVTYGLAAGCEVEALETTDPAAMTALDLVGNEFANTITGNDGQNVIVGGLGLDILTGNNGGDTFAWTSSAETGPDAMTADVVTDFNRLEGDLIAVNPVDADGDPANGDQAFTFVGTAPFTAAGQISYYNTATDTYIQFNIDADEAPEMMIQIVGVHTPDASWFVL